MSGTTDQRKASKGKSERKIKNFLLMPSIQIKLGAYMIALAIVLLAALVSIIYIKMAEIVALIVQLTDVEEEVREVLLSYVQSMSWWILLAICIYILVNMCLSIWYTHKMVGPTYAFRRHIKSLIKGDFTAKTALRKGDVFAQLAGDLNELSDALARQDKSKTGPEDSED